MENIQMLLKQGAVGKPCEAIVKKGDKVNKGQLIATPTGLGANVHSSVSGEVIDINDEMIVIKPDAEQPKTFEKIKKGSNLEMIKEAGIIGQGGAGFPTFIKIYNGKEDKPVLDHGYILVNASECEPGLAHNIAQIDEDPATLLRGIHYIMEIAGADKGIIAIKKKHRETIEKLDALLKDDPAIERHLLPDIYPMGEERAVVRECLGIELEPDKLPSAANAVVINSETVYSCVAAIEDQKPCIDKWVTVRGMLKGGSAAHVFKGVPVGVSVKTLIEKAGGADEECGYGEIIMGGAFTGKSTTLDAPITKTTGAILLTRPFRDLKGAKVGILVCACGGNLERMQELVQKYNGTEACVCYCKQAQEMPNGTRKCERPGNCPGQVQNNLDFKKAGCEYIIIGNCSDCSNTVMASGPKMGLKVMHMTDLAMMAVGHPLYRTLRVSKQVDQDLNVVDNVEDNETVQ
ncbi:MAG: proline reductase-associated electron transfer protein PrdC [Mogibacterium sp.]|nr:proline reductase-associated electron transfer protein PrdC [Mogibacterium sp.]